MANLAQQTDQQLTAVLGIGVTGLSVARFLAERGVPFIACDTRDHPPLLQQFQADFPDIDCYLGADVGQVLAVAAELIVSPGLSPNEPLLVAAREKNIPIVGDIELFARVVNAPIVAITGSNGKSTVTELLGEMAKAAGRHVAVGGNLGTPALALLDEDCELYVLELSSFQLEITESLKPAVACILNLSEDHLDRYGSMADYLAAKQRIFNGARHIVCNRDDSATRPSALSDENACGVMGSEVELSSFGFDTTSGCYGIAQQNGKTWLTGPEGGLLPVDELRLKGRHNWANSLAAMAMASAVGLPIESMIDVLRNFGGLDHRCQTVAVLNDVSYINDSKATNIGATLTALEGLGDQQRNNIVWIAGGESKGAVFGKEFDELITAVARFVKQALLIGADAEAIAAKVSAHTPVEFCKSIEQAVSQAQALAQPGDLVLLSPACASLDMFRNFEARGDAFIIAVEALV